MSDKIKFINTDEASLVKELKEYTEKVRKTDINNVKVSPEEQKWFWLTVFLPSAISVVAAILIKIFLISMITNKVASTACTVVLFLVVGYFLATRTLKITKFEPFQYILMPPVCSPKVKLLYELKHKKIKEVSTYEMICDDGKTVLFPEYITFEDDNDKLSNYVFEKHEWEIFSSSLNAPCVDVSCGQIFCPTVGEEETA